MAVAGQSDLFEAGIVRGRALARAMSRSGREGRSDHRPVR